MEDLLTNYKKSARKNKKFRKNNQKNNTFSSPVTPTLQSPNITPLSVNYLARLASESTNESTNENTNERKAEDESLHSKVSREKEEKQELMTIINAFREFDKFNGENDALSFKEWLERFTRKVKYFTSSELVMFRALTFMLAGKALNKVEAARCNSIEEIKRLIIGEDYSKLFAFNFYDEINNVRQGELDVSSYLQLIKNICSKHDVKDEKIIKDYFMRGLNCTDAKREIIHNSPQTLDEVEKIAKKYETEASIASLVGIPVPKTVVNNHYYSNSNNKNYISNVNDSNKYNKNNYYENKRKLSPKDNNNNNNNKHTKYEYDQPINSINNDFDKTK